MTILRVFIKLIVFLIFVLLFLFVSFFVYFSVSDEFVRRKKFIRINSFFAGLTLKLMGVRLTVLNKPSEPDPSFLIVSNHMGFIDILCLASIYPSTFVTSREMRETPLLGIVTEMAGCVYVERRSRSNIIHEMKHLAENLRKGFRVCLYPEATSHNGEEVLPFKRNLIMSAALAGVPIQPVVVNFRKINGEDFILKYRDNVCWWGDMGFPEALFKMFSLKHLNVEVEFLDKVHAGAEDDKVALADQLHKAVSSKFVPVKNNDGTALIKNPSLGTKNTSLGTGNSQKLLKDSREGYQNS